MGPRQKPGPKLFSAYRIFIDKRTTSDFVMVGLVPAIHAFFASRRGCPAQARAWRREGRV